MVWRAAKALVPACAVVFLSVCASAGAATAREYPSCDRYNDTCINSLVYAVARGERMHVGVSDTAAGVLIDESAATVRAGAGCAARGAHQLLCDPADGIYVFGGDRGNLIDARRVSHAGVFMVGGAGHDRMLSSPAGGAEFFPGRGHTSLTGGPGDELHFDGLQNEPIPDHVVYPVGTKLYVNLARHIARGANGMVVHMTGIEKVVGGDGDETLIGDRRNNELCGGDGRNLIVGKGGNDTLASNGPADLIGGPGRSILGFCKDYSVGTATDGPTRFQCASSADTVDLAADPYPAHPYWTFGSRCRRIIGLSSGDGATRLRLNAPNPSRDYIWLPLSRLELPSTASASLTAPDGTLLGSVPPTHTTRHRHGTSLTIRPTGILLRISAAGANYLRAHRPLTAELNFRASGCSFGCTEGIYAGARLRIA